MRIVVRVIAGLVGMMILGGCADSTTTPEPARSTPVAEGGSSSASFDSARETLNTRWRAVANSEAPGFAGMFLEGDRLVVLTAAQDDANRSRASEWARSAVAARPDVAAVTTRQVDHSFETLSQWAEALYDLLDLPLVYGIDIDEVENRVTLLVDKQADRGGLTDLVKQRQVPIEGVLIEAIGRPQPRVHLATNPQPEAGFAITIIDQSGTRQTCTMGYNALWNGKETFITASHCSSVVDGPDSGPAEQPSGTKIAEEVFDISPNQAGIVCPVPGGDCRASDASMYEYEPGVPRRFGTVARTSWEARGGDGSRIIDPDDPYWTINDVLDQFYLWAGQALHKVGQRSGWTWGEITRTCFDHGWTDQFGNARRLTCQFESDIWSRGGDSGAPVFGRNFHPPCHCEIDAAGILWGGPEGNLNYSWWSPIDNGVESDLGPFTIF